MPIKLLLALIVATLLQSCTVYVPPLDVGGLVIVPSGGNYEHRKRGHKGHDRDDD